MSNLPAQCGRFDVDLFYEFFRVLLITPILVHIDNIRGRNTHHQIESIFKAFARALRMATELDPRMAGQMPSTKGSAYNDYRCSVRLWHG
jgi:imidazoleglycerol-phosphate dehydratase